jgi:hypothetical protein
VHDLFWLRHHWALAPKLFGFWHTQPLFAVRAHFGEKTALYFGWLEYYTWSLKYLTILGIFIFIIRESASEWYKPGAIIAIMSAWSVFFANCWRRKCSVLNLAWGMNDLKSVETTRQEFVGEMRMDPHTDKEEKSHKYSRHGCYLHVLGRHFPITFRSGVGYTGLSILAVACLCFLSALIMYSILSASAFSPTVTAFLSTAQYMCLGELFRAGAVYLTHLENPRTETVSGLRNTAA